MQNSYRMNILFINDYDCMVNASGGIMRVSQLLLNYFSSKQHHCFLGYFDDTQGEPAIFQQRIKLSVPFENEQFKNFLEQNHIHFIISTLWTQKHIGSFQHIYTIASSLNIKVLFELHVLPGHEMRQSVSFNQFLFSLGHRQNIKTNCVKWLISKGSFLLKPLYKARLRRKYQIPFDYSDRIIVLSKYYIPVYAQIIGTNNLSKITAIGNVLSYPFFSSFEDIQQKKKEIIIVGRLYEPAKRISLALKIWEKVEQNPLLSEWTLTIVGEGEDRLYYEYLTQKFHLKRVTFTGRQNPVEYYQRASIILMTSAAEGWPMVLMEAAQMGVPCVAFDSFEALHEIVTDGHNGIIVPNNNINMFYEKLANLMLNDDKRKQIALNAVGDSKRFTMENIMPKWDDLLNQISTESSAIRN